MFNISKILESIGGKHNKILLQRSAIAELIQKESGIIVAPKDIMFANGVLSISLRDQAGKNEFYIKKQKIITAIKTQLPSLAISDIKIN